MSLGTRRAVRGSIPLFATLECGAGVAICVTGDIEYTVEPCSPGDWNHPPEGGDVEYEVKPTCVELIALGVVESRLDLVDHTDVQHNANHWAVWAVHVRGDADIQQDCREDAERRSRHE